MELKKLDVVHNAVLRLCSGAFKTSPVESIYVDCDQLPFYLRRQELSLQHLTRLKSSKENPAFQIFRNCDSTKFTGARSSKPLQIRINEEVQDVNVKQQKILEVAHPTFPPWKTPEPSICSNPLPAGKSSLSAEESRSCFFRT